MISVYRVLLSKLAIDIARFTFYCVNVTALSDSVISFLFGLTYIGIFEIHMIY